MTILKKIWNWLLGKTNIDEKLHEAKETVIEKVGEAKEYIKNVEKEVSDVVDAVAGKKEEPEVAPQSEPIAELVVEEPKAFETAIVKPKPKKKYYKKKTAKKEK